MTEEDGDKQVQNLVVVEEKKPERVMTLEEEFAEIERELAEKKKTGEVPSVYSDWIENPDETLSARHKELCRLIAKGYRNKDVCLKLGYSPSRVSVLLQNVKIQAEIAKFQDRMFDRDLDTRMGELGPDAMDVIQKALTSDTYLKPQGKVDLAKWSLEKLTGKAVQRSEVDTGANLSRLLDKLHSISDIKDVLEVGVKDPAEKAQDAEFTEVDPISSWVKQNLD